MVVFGRIFVDSDRQLYKENLPHLARLFSIHAPLLLVVAMPNDRKTLKRCLLGFGLLATAVSVMIAVLYHFGSSAFDAHQTFQRQGGTLSHRLGGLTGESGAFAFNATLGIQLLLVGLAMTRSRKCFYFALWCVFPLFVALVYHESLARIALLNSVIFFLLSLVGVNHTRGSWRFLLLILIIVGSFGFVLLSAAGSPFLDVQVERVNFEGSLDRLSSGRVSHWQTGVETWLESPSYILFGMGHRAPDFVLGHPIENMLVFHLANYGIIGSTLFATLYFMVAWPVIRHGIRGEFAAGVFAAMLASVIVQWQVNDVNLYYQTFPVILFFAAWYSVVLRNEQTDAQPASEREKKRVLR